MRPEEPDKLADRLLATGAVTPGALERAFRDVPRRNFVPPASEAVAEKDVCVLWRGESCASQPSVVAGMLQQLDLRQGQRVLEIGAATGYNAALMAHIVGSTGQVVTVELDRDMAAIAAQNLARIGMSNVEVRHADAALEFRRPEHYDRIIWTCASWELPPMAVQRTGVGGVIVLPMILRGNLQKALAFHVGQKGIVSSDARSVRFVVQRGRDDMMAPRTIPLDGGWWIVSESTVPPDIEEIMSQPPNIVRTGVESTDDEAVFELAAWLAIRNPAYCSVEANFTPANIGLLNAGPRLGAPHGRMGIGLVGENGIALVGILHAEDQKLAGELVIMVRGEGTVGEALLSEVRAWSKTHRDTTARLTVEYRLEPNETLPDPGLANDCGRAASDGECSARSVIPKRMSSLVISY